MNVIAGIDYGDVSGADLGSNGLTVPEVKHRTKRGKTYVFKADKSDEVELKEMVNSVQSRITTVWL